MIEKIKKVVESSLAASFVSCGKIVFCIEPLYQESLLSRFPQVFFASALI